MKLITNGVTYDTTVMFLPKNSVYMKDISFHTFLEDSEVNNLHLLSIYSCAFHHSRENFTINVWIMITNKHTDSLRKAFEHYTNIKLRIFNQEIMNTIKDTILYDYGGCWFEPTVVFLKTIEALFWTYGKHVCTFQTGTTMNVNPNIMISMSAKDPVLKDFLCSHDKEVIMFPSSWIDPLSVSNPFTNVNDYHQLCKKDTHFNFYSYSVCCKACEGTEMEEGSTLKGVWDKVAPQTSTK